MTARPDELSGPPAPDLTPEPGGPPAESAALETRGLGVRVDDRDLLSGIDLVVHQGGFLGVLGPNGSGKTTLLRCLTGTLPATDGMVLLEGRPVAELTRRQIARRVGVVPQTFTLEFKFTVEEVVALGRYPYRSAWGRGDHDDGPVRAALEALSIAHLAERPVTELSGGERQRVLIAQTLAQETPILLLDEPLNNLDLNHQLEVMQLLTRLHVEGRTIVVVLHDINMAAQYCEEVALLSRGRLVARGTPDALLTPELILDVFATRVAVHRLGGRPYVTPVALAVPTLTAGARFLRVHVVTGGGAAARLLEDLAHLGFTPTVGLVSVFDSDYEVAQRYGLPVVSAPPFQPLPDPAVEEHRALAAAADCIVVAPQVFGPGNLANLHVALEAARAGRRVLVLDAPPVAERDLAEGRATALQHDLLTAGAEVTADPDELVRVLCRLAAERSASPAG